MASKIKINRLDMPKLPTALQFGYGGELLSIDFCTDSQIPPLENEKTSFSTVILTKSTAKKLYDALEKFLAEEQEE